METDNQRTPTDEIIEKAKQTEAAGSPSFMEPEVKEKKRKGRPPGSNKSKGFTASTDKKESPGNTQTESAVPKFDIPTKTLCYLPGKALSGWGVSYLGDPKAAMTPDELEAFATGLGMVIDKHLPDAMKNYGPELMFAMSLTQYGVRIMAMKKLRMMHMAKMQNQPNQNMTQNTTVPENKRPKGVHLVETQEETVIP